MSETESVTHNTVLVKNLSVALVHNVIITNCGQGKWKVNQYLKHQLEVTSDC